jgi:hypothetical protein
MPRRTVEDRLEKGWISTWRALGVGLGFHNPTARPSTRMVGFSQPPPSRLICFH